MPTLTITPNPATPGSWLTFKGTAFSRTATQFLLDGILITTLKPASDGSLTFGAAASTSSITQTQTLVARQKKSGVWTEVARASVVVQVAAPTPTPTPTPTPGPVVTPVQPQVVSYLPPLDDNADIKNLIVNPASNLTVQDQVNASPSSGVYAKGKKFIKLTSVTTTGREWGFQLVDCDDLIATDCVATDLNYCAFGIFGGKRGQLIRPVWKRVGTLRGPTGLPSIGDAGNAYGVKFENSAKAYQSGTLNLDPDTWMVDGWLGEDVSQWQSVNAHEGANLTIQNGISRRCPRGIFLVGHIVNATVVNNQLLEPAGLHSFGSTDQSAITYGGWTGGKIDANAIASAYATKLNNIGGQYGIGPNTGVVVGTNPTV